MATNVEGSYNAAHAAYPHMKAAGRGKVVLISSIAGSRSAGAQLAYAVSKGAVLSLGRSLAAAWGKDK
jgi:NAD(P)-dependent dehydrogenase (short-subunit alcohol dehydrogenase family)